MQSLARLTATISLVMLTSACSTVMEGRTQDISVDTVPSGASCLIKDNDIVLAKVQTPAVAKIEKSKNDILVECSKEGYSSNKQRNRADMAITSLGNMVLGKLSVVGDMVDTASGAAHKYDSRVFMVLNPLPPVARIDTAAPAATSEESAPQNQLALDLARLLASPNVLVTHQSAQEVINHLVNGEPLQETQPVDDGLATGPVTLVAQNTSVEYHHAE